MGFTMPDLGGFANGINNSLKDKFSNAQNGLGNFGGNISKSIGDFNKSVKDSVGGFIGFWANMGKGASDFLSKLNPMNWFKNLKTVGIVLVVAIIIIIIIYMVLQYRTTNRMMDDWSKVKGGSFKASTTGISGTAHK